MDDHDMEMIAMNNVHPRQNGDTLFENEDYDDDTSSASEDDGSRGLLTGSSERSYRHEQPRQLPPQKPLTVWPQIKSIVIEVRVNCLHSLPGQLIM
jgi:hypothetical protein